MPTKIPMIPQRINKYLWVLIHPFTIVSMKRICVLCGKGLPKNILTMPIIAK